MNAVEHDHTFLAEKRALAARLGASMVVGDGSRHGTPFDASDATNRSLLGLLTDKPVLPYDRLPCDPPTRAQAGFLGIRSRVLELLDNGADTCGCESRENGYLKAAPAEAWESIAWRAAAGTRRHL